MNNFAKGMLALFCLREPAPVPSAEEMEREVWQGVGDALRSAMHDYEQTKEYKQAINVKPGTGATGT